MLEEGKDERLDLLRQRLQFYHRRAVSLRSGPKTVREQDYLDGQLELAQQLLTELIQIQEDGQIMEMGDNQLVVRVVKLSEIKLRRKRTDTDLQIIELCKQLDAMVKEAERNKQDAPALVVNTEKISAGNMANRLSDLRKEGLIDPRFTTTKVGDDVYLIKRDEPVEPKGRHAR